MSCSRMGTRLDLERYNGVKGERQEPRQAVVVQPAQAEAKKGNDIRQVAGQEAEVKRENNIKTAAAKFFPIAANAIIPARIGVEQGVPASANAIPRSTG